MEKSIICLMGPTAAGKTQLAVELVQQFPLEIISVDSAMVYRGLNIGTAKPDQTILQIAPHRLIDIRDPSEPYSAAQFTQDAKREIEDIFSQGKIPLLVGGTMLYFHALQNGLAEMPSADEAIRGELSREGQEQGWHVLHERLKVIDPTAAERIHPHDSQRIQRALEVYLSSGKTLTRWQEEQGDSFLHYPILNMIVAPEDRSILHKRIAQRFTAMLAEGLVEEVQVLYQRGDLNLETPAIRSVGYRQVWQYLAGEINYEEMREKGIIATRQLAKRQLTWLRSWPNAVWFNSESADLYAKVAAHVAAIE